MFVSLGQLQGQLQGVVLCEHDELVGMKPHAINWGSDVRKVLALCNDLIPVHRKLPTGPQEEQRVFQNVEAVYLVHASSFADMLMC